MLPRTIHTASLAAGLSQRSAVALHHGRLFTTASAATPILSPSILSQHTRSPLTHRPPQPLSLTTRLLPTSTSSSSSHIPRRSIQQKTAGHGPEWVTSTRGSPDTESFRLYFHHRSNPTKPLSPWHDIPLLSTNHTSLPKHNPTERLYHYVNEIPRGSTAKMEVSTTTQHNPIAQDIKKGKLRHFTYGTIPFNYGCLPQTWEDPTATHPQTQCKGDNDPVDVVELSTAALPVGSVHTVRVLGVLALIDEGETDWKLLAVNTADPLYARLHSVEDVERELPGVVDGVKRWFKYYKTTDGKGVNVLGFDERVLGVGEAEDVIRETHEAWRELVEGKKEAAKLWLREGKVEGVGASKA